jgi:hypothetical protein
MKLPILKSTLCILLGASLSAPAAPVLLPNGDFAAAGGAQWATAFGGAQAFSFPNTGGNPDGYASITSSEAGGFAVLVSNGDLPYPLASLGLVAGKTYNFTYDMLASQAGANKGGIKMESWSATAAISNSGDRRVTAATTGWASYSYAYTIDPAATHLKMVPLWTPGQTVGFDNLGVNNTPVVLPPVVPNGGFETPAGAGWLFFQGGGQTSSYPATGGNPSGHAVINSVGLSSFAGLVSNGIPLATLGLTAGQTYTFAQDMKILGGPAIGGLKVEFLPGTANTGDLYPAQIIGNGSTWETYTFRVALPLGVTQIRLVPLWGPNSNVAYDNIRVALPPPPGQLVASITEATALTWSASSAVNGYQPQESDDGSTWTNLGPVIVGNAVNSVFDTTKSAFYQVLEAVPATLDAVTNGGFEEEGRWTPVQSQPPTRITTDFRSGTASMKIKVANTGSAANGSEIQQNTRNIDPVNGVITPGNTYLFSFWARQISSGPSYVQQFKVSFLNDNGNIMGDGGIRNFSPPVGGTWTRITQPNLTAPAGATTALIQIIGVTGAVAGGLGEVNIDDVALTSLGFGDQTVIASTTGPGVEISWPSVTGRNYQIQTSTDLSAWSNFGSPIAGNDTTKTFKEAVSIPRKFFRVQPLP